MSEKYSIDDIETMLGLIARHWPRRNAWEQLRTYMANGTTRQELEEWLEQEQAKTPGMRHQGEMQKIAEQLDRLRASQALQALYGNPLSKVANGPQS